jgi:hypothetical protein
VFGALEVNRVPSGLLLDYGFDFTNPKIYNGSVLVDSTLMEQGIYSELYKTLFTTRFNSNAVAMRHPSVHDSLCYMARQREVITLSGLLFKYNAIDPNAQANGTMQTINGQLRDVYVNGVWQNPYQEFTTVAISPSIIKYKLTYCSVLLPSTLFMSNMLSQISSIQFNAGDGQGYRSIQYDVPLSLSYADTGWKHWTFRVNLTNGQQLYSHSKIHFNNTSNASGSGGVAARGVVDMRFPVTATEQFNGIFGVADILISYRNINDQVIRRPLIVAEGFDPGHITSPEEPEGESNFEGFIRTITNSGSNALRNQISNSPSEYDIIYVNWRNGTDWLQRNALLLEEIIREVNRRKQPLAGVRQPNVVLGSSMGGVIARMALGRMDRAGGVNAHETRLFISLDAPHQGANVPLGLQAMARHAARQYLKIGPGTIAVVETIQLLSDGPSPLRALFLADRPAARQLLINRLNFNYNLNNADNQQFLQELRTQWAYPVNIRNVAISDGNECAINQEFAPGSTLLYHYRSTKTRFITDLITMAAGAGIIAGGGSIPLAVPLLIPGSNQFELTLDIRTLANGGSNQVYYGNIKYTKKIVWLVPVSINITNKTYNAPSGLLPFDTYPGGFYHIQNPERLPGTASQDWAFTYNNSFYIMRRFAFIHTTSALDIGGGNVVLTNTEYTARYIGANPPAPPLNTPFVNFSTAYNTNDIQWDFDNNNRRRLNNFPHEWIFIRSANWLATEINNAPVTTNCNAFCTNGAILGNPAVCNSENFTAPFGNNVTYNWSLSNTSIATLTVNNNVATVTRNGNGTAVLTVTMTGDCGNSTLSINLTIGAPEPPIIFASNYDAQCGTFFEAYCTEPTSWTGFRWDINFGQFVQDQTGNFTNYVYVSPLINEPQTGQQYYNYVTVQARNACGLSAPSATLQFTIGPVPSSCGNGGPILLKIAPNPGINMVSIESTDNSRFSELRIYDRMGNLRKQLSFPATKKTTVNISDLPAGTYNVRAFLNNSWRSAGFIKQ